MFFFLFSDNSRYSTQSYWSGRLRPLQGKKCVFVATNRVGVERGIVVLFDTHKRKSLNEFHFTNTGSKFCGGSCAISMEHPSLIASLSKKEENVLVINIK
jgi:hypothetical protein